MRAAQIALPKWILIVSGIFALLEIMVSFSLFFAPESVVHDSVDLHAKGVDYLFKMWAGRQLAFGIILALATWKRSIPMLTIAYVFFLIMMIADLIAGITQKENSLIIAALVMCVVSSGLLYVINRKK
jgi:hypothetical protein